MVLGKTVTVKLARGECEPGAIVVDNTAKLAKNVAFQAFYEAAKEMPLPTDAGRDSRPDGLRDRSDP